MPDTILLSADRVSKLYARRTGSRRARLAQIVWPALLGLPATEPGELREHEFWAVNDVSFELRKGEAIGVIGLNGSGKTTLLRMLAGQILPDKGEIRIAGSSAAMIDLQAGFQPAASGRQNIFLRSAALGFSRKQTIERLDEIIDFSELGDAIDAPMASYSSGMKMRLAFSVMATVAPDVLFIDEVLGVGDFRFRQKSLAKIREMRKRSAFVFVSHSMGEVARFCDRVLVMNKGNVDFDGSPDKAISHYLQNQPDNSSLRQVRVETRRNVDARAPSAKIVGSRIAETIAPEPYQDAQTVANVTAGATGGAKNEVRCEQDEELEFSVCADILRPCRKLLFGFTVLTDDGMAVSGIASDAQGDWLSLDRPSTVEARVRFERLSLNPGRYAVFFNMRDGPELLFRNKVLDLYVPPVAHNTLGPVTLSHRWTVGIVGDIEPTL